MEKLSIIVLAAGKSTRMKSKTSKLLYQVLGLSLIQRVVDTLLQLNSEKIVLVLGHQKDEIEKHLEKLSVLPKICIVEQKEQLGTGHAVKVALDKLPKSGRTIILSADTPFLNKTTLEELVEACDKNSNLSLLVARMDDPKHYGRIVTKNGCTKIVEYSDATDEEKRIKLVNGGVYCANNSFLINAISKLKKNNKQKEYYLTDIIEVATEINPASVVIKEVYSYKEVMGMNDKIDLAKLQKERQIEICEKWMKEGVTIHDPGSTIIEEEVKLSKDVEIYPSCYLKGKTEIGEGTVIYPGSYIVDSKIMESVIVKPYSIIESSRIHSKVTIGPFAHLRPGAEICESAKVGNFVELKKAKLGEGSKANHLTYLGDAEIGKNVNIGCGVITCNYDGEKKHKTIIEDNVFIGSDNQLVAPVTVKEGAYTASGSTITKDVPAGALAVARVKQINKEGYVEKLKKQRKKG